jgi:hypothetical protein
MIQNQSEIASGGQQMMSSFPTKAKRVSKTVGYAVADEGIIIDLIGWGQVFSTRGGISLDKVYKGLGRLRTQSQRIHYQQLKATMSELAEKGVLVRGEQNRWPTWMLADWKAWAADLDVKFEIVSREHVPTSPTQAEAAELQEIYWDEKLDGPRPDPEVGE